MSYLMLLIFLQGPITAAHLDADSGLSQSSIWQVMQDRTGYMWFATSSGLNRWDGYRFEVYLNDPENSKSLPHNNINALAEDLTGHIWLATSGGACYFDPASNSFHMPKAFRDTELENRDVRTLSIDKNILWIGTGRGLWMYQLEKERLVKLAIRAPRSSSEPWGWYSVRTLLSLEDHLWIGTEAGLIRYHRETRKLDYLLPDDLNAPRLTIRSMTRTADGTVWVGTSEGLYGWQESRQTWLHFGARTNGLLDPWVNVLFTMPDSTLFVGTQSSGLFRFDPRTQHFTRWSLVSDSPWDQNILSLTRDSSGLLWAGTFRTGVYRFDSKPPKFQDVTNLYTARPRAKVTATATEPDGDVWLGVNSDLIHYQRHLGMATEIPLPKDASGITAITRGRNNTYWIGTQTELYFFEEPTRSFQKQDMPVDQPFSVNAIALSSANLWVATNVGLFVKQGEEAWERYAGVTSDLDWGRASVNSLLPDLKGGIWLATNNQGLVYIDRHNRVAGVKKPLLGISDLPIFDLERDTSGTLWIGTPHGLFSLDKNGESIVNYGQNHVALGTQINAIAQAPDQRIWLGTPYGLICYDPVEDRLQRFGIKEGLRLERYHRNAISYLPDGQLLMGGDIGIFAFYPERIRQRNYTPQLVFTDVRLFDKTLYSGTQLSNMPRLKLGPNENHLTLSFAALDYHAPAENRFYYKLDGLDSDWVDSGTRHTARYNDLSGGNYTFRVRAADDQGSLPRSQISIAISIRPHFWQQLWFWVVFVLVSLLAIIFTDRWRERAIHRRNRQLEELVEEKKRDLEATKMELLETAHFAGIHDIANTVLNQMKHELDLIRTSIRQIQKAEKASGLEALIQATASFNEALKSTDGQAADRLFASAQSGFQVFLQQSGMAREKIETHTAKLEKHVSTMRETIQLQHSLAKNPLFASQVQLQELLEDTLKLERGDILRINVRVKRDYRTEGEVVLPKVKMMKVLTQLVRNSLEAMARGNTTNPTLTLRLFEDLDQSWFIEIEDNGPGIDPSHMESVTKQGWSTVGQAGLGLHECVRALKDLKGHLNLLSGEHGEGTRAIINLPKN